jgi:hypothetical protein
MHKYIILFTYVPLYTTGFITLLFDGFSIIWDLVALVLGIIPASSAPSIKFSD